MSHMFFLIVGLASLAAVLALVLNLRDGVQTDRACIRAAHAGAMAASVMVGGYLLGADIGWSADRALIGIRWLIVIHYAAATAIGLAVAGVYLSFGRTRWRAALCGAGTVAGFLTVLALVHGAGV